MGSLKRKKEMDSGDRDERNRFSRKVLSKLPDLTLADFVRAGDNRKRMLEAKDSVMVLAMVCEFEHSRLNEFKAALKREEEKKKKRSQVRVGNKETVSSLGKRVAKAPSRYMDDEDGGKSKKAKVSKMGTDPNGATRIGKPRRVRKVTEFVKFETSDYAGDGSLRGFLAAQVSGGTANLDFKSSWKGKGAMETDADEEFLMRRREWPTVDDKPECSRRWRRVGSSEIVDGENDDQDSPIQRSSWKGKAIMEDADYEPEPTGKAFMADARRSYNFAASLVINDDPDWREKKKKAIAKNDTRYLATQENDYKPRQSKKRCKEKVSDFKPKKRPKPPQPPENTGPEPPPPLSEDFKAMITEKGGSEPVLVIQKRLFGTDLAKHNNRLSIPLPSIRNEFLTEEEKAWLCDKDNGHWNPIELKIYDQTGKTWDINMRRWEMGKGDSARKSITYNLNSPWNAITVANGWNVGDVIQIWAFRIDGKVALAVIYVQEELHVEDDAQ